MQIVIDIPEEVYERFEYEYSEKDLISPYVAEVILDAFTKGTVLPKGHGRLIILSEDAVKKERCRVTFSRQYWISEIGLSNATVAIIEVDKAEGRDKE